VGAGQAIIAFLERKRADIAILKSVGASGGFVFLVFFLQVMAVALAATLVGAAITAFYMTRLVAMTFLGKARWPDDAHPHESPAMMMVPVSILAVLSAVSGFLLIHDNWIVNWLEPVVGFEEPVLGFNVNILQYGALALVLVSAALGYVLYARRPVPEVAPVGSFLTQAARADLYGDAVNEAVFMRPGQYLTRLLVWFDNRVVDGAVNGTAALIGGLSGRARRTQNGFARSYALTMLGGAALVIAALVLVRL
jgi:NADH-quinone oxidoreductase subunit L